MILLKMEAGNIKHFYLVDFIAINLCILGL